jgi:hypothetical protein
MPAVGSLRLAGGAVAQVGGKYLKAMPMRHGDEVIEVVHSRPARYRKVAENLAVRAGDRR